MIHLKEITRENWREATFITTDPAHKCPLDEEWVASTAFSIVQSVYEPEWESRLITDDEEIVGFVFFGFWREKNVPLLCRLTIDVEKQNHGYGQAALPVILKEMRTRYSCDEIYLTLEQENKRAVHIYEKFGFVFTGEYYEGEAIYRYHCSERSGDRAT